MWSDRNAAISDSYGSIDDSFSYRRINSAQLNISPALTLVPERKA